MGRFDGRVAIVTGAGRGIGREHALLLAREGAAVVVNDIADTPEGTGTASAVVDDIVGAGGRAVANHDDVARWSGAQALIEHAIVEFGALDILVNNAGVLRDGFLGRITEEQWDAVVDTNLKGQAACLHHAAAHWKSQFHRGRRRRVAVVNTTSASGTTVPVLGQANHAAAAAGVVALTHTAATELARYGVRVNAVAPTASTGLWPSGIAAPHADEEADAAGAVDDPFGTRSASSLVAFLVDRDCRLTGKVFAVGGRSISELSGFFHISTADSAVPWTIDAIEARLAGTVSW